MVGTNTAAVRAWDLGKTVCIVEKSWLGGAGVWDGALSSKTQWQLSRRARGFSEMLRSSKAGLNYEGNFDEVCVAPLHGSAQFLTMASLSTGA